MDINMAIEQYINIARVFSIHYSARRLDRMFGFEISNPQE